MLCIIVDRFVATHNPRRLKKKRRINGFERRVDHEIGLTYGHRGIKKKIFYYVA